MKRQDISALVERGEAHAVTPPRRGPLLWQIAEYFGSDLSKEYGSLYRIEWIPQWFLRRRRTDGTVLEPVVTLLRQRGIAVEPTIGSVMDVLQLSSHQLHEAFCWCHGCNVQAYRARNFFHQWAVQAGL